MIKKNWTTKEIIAQMTDEEIIEKTRWIGEAFDEIQKLKKIDVQRDWLLKNRAFKEMTLTSAWMRELVVDLVEEMPEIEMKYIVSIVLCPDMFNIWIQRRINKINNPDLFTDPLEVIEEIKEIHKNYKRDASMFWIYDFTAEVMKFERKTATKQLKFIISNEVADYFNENFENMEKSSLVFAKFISVK